MDFSLENLKQYQLRKWRTIIVNRKNFDNFIQNVADANPNYRMIHTNDPLTDPFVRKCAFPYDDTDDVSLYFEDDGLAIKVGTFNPFCEVDYYSE